MPAASRLVRLVKLIEALQSGRLWNADQLAQHTRVSRRTTFRDLAVLQEAGVHVSFDTERQAYYLPLQLRIPPQELTVEEALSLKLVCQELGGRPHGIPFLQSAQTAAEKILQALPIRLKTRVASATEPLAIRIPPRNALPHGQVHYQLLLQSLLEARQLRIEYSSATDQRHLRLVLSPYRLLFARRSWYVIGRSSLHRAVRTFNLGRIRQATLLETPYAIPPRFSLKRHLGLAWSLIRQRKEHHQIALRFSRKVAMNVSEIEWHATQRAEFLPEGEVRLHFEIEGLDEISWWILGYGDQVVVEHPPELQTLIKQRLKQAIRRYDES